jgi:alginate O-acetyltransferase complex protein AlgJ
MRDNQWMPAARVRAGDRVTLHLRPWAEVSAEYEKFNRTELDDPTLQLEEPAWGELLP